MSAMLLTKENLEFVSLKGGCTGSTESTLLKMPHCWKSHVEAHMGLEAKNLSLVVCEQHRRRPGCAYAQTDQHLRYWLFGKYHI